MVLSLLLVSLFIYGKHACFIFSDVYSNNGFYMALKQKSDTIKYIDSISLKGKTQ